MKPILLLGVGLLVAVPPGSARGPAAASAAPRALPPVVTAGLAPPSAKPSELATGKFLVAARQLSDPNFAESVLLLLEYGRQGAVALIVNRPTAVKLSSLLPEVKELRGASHRVFAGGPVGQTGLMLLLRGKDPPAPSLRVFDDVYATGSADVLRAWGGRGQEVIHAYVGHAGWGPGQLDGEVSRGDWYVSDGDASRVFSADPSHLWRDLVQSLEGQWAGAGRSGARAAALHMKAKRWNGAGRIDFVRRRPSERPSAAHGGRTQTGAGRIDFVRRRPSERPSAAHGGDI